jgi:hypothetical protein
VEKLSNKEKSQNQKVLVRSPDLVSIGDVAMRMQTLLTTLQKDSFGVAPVAFVPSL